MSRLRKVAFVVVVLAVLVMTWSTLTSASTAGTIDADRSGAYYSLPESAAVADDLFAGGAQVSVRGDVSGDLAAVGQSVNVSGKIGGDVLVLAQNALVSGKVNGDVRAAGQAIRMDGGAEKNVTAFGAQVIIGQSGSIGKNLLLAAQSIEVGGTVGGKARLYGEDVVVSGKIGGDLIVESKDLTVTDSAEITGGIKYKGRKPPAISNGAKVGGQVDYEPVVGRETASTRVVLDYLLSLLRLIVLTLAIALFTSGAVNRIVEESTRKPLLGLGVALLSFIAVPLAIVLLAMTVVGQSVAIAIGAGYMSTLVVVLVLTKAMFSVAVGRFLAVRLKRTVPEWVSLIIGAAVVYAITFIPVVGFIVNLGVGLLMLGTVLRQITANIITWPPRVGNIT